MSLGYPPLRPQPGGSTVVGQAVCGQNVVPDLMLNGARQNNQQRSSGHPLEYSEKLWRQHQEKMDFAMLRNSQGLHAPLVLQMERKIASQMQRLPGLASSNLMLDTLTGRLDSVDFEDFLNDPMDAEKVGHPHVVMERRLGLL